MPAESVDLGPLVDHHCHGLVLDDLDRSSFEAMMNEAAATSPLGRPSSTPCSDWRSADGALQFSVWRRTPRPSTIWLAVESSVRKQAGCWWRPRASTPSWLIRALVAGGCAPRPSSRGWAAARRTRWSGWRHWPRTCCRKGSPCGLRGDRRAGAAGVQCCGVEEHRRIPGGPRSAFETSKHRRPRCCVEKSAVRSRRPLPARRPGDQRLARLDRDRDGPAVADPRGLWRR